MSWVALVVGPFLIAYAWCAWRDIAAARQAIATSEVSTDPELKETAERERIGAEFNLTMAGVFGLALVLMAWGNP